MSEAAVALAPWIAAQRTSLLAQRGHAWLLQGPSGLGQYALGLELVRAWLCDNAPTLPAARGSLPPEGALAALGRPGGGSVPTQQGACGHCGSCHAIDVRTHADLCVLMPEVQMMALGWPLSEKAQADIDDKKRKPSREIRVEAMRDAVEFSQRTSARGKGKAVLVYPAEQMNHVTANALLKTLEEPPGDVRFVLASEAAHQLLPTIRSRCQQWHFARPSEAELAHWKAQADRDTQALLALGGGMPLAAERLAEAGGGALLARFVRDIGGLQAADVLRLAGQWEAWLKSKEATASGFGLPELSDWMQRWVSDLAAVRLGGRVRFFPAQESVLAALASRMSVAAASGCYNELAQIHKVSRHPRSLRLVLEDMLMRYARAIAGARG